MAARDIVLYPQGEAILRRRSTRVRRISPQVQRLVQDLRDTLNAHPEGVGLAAPQIGVHSRVIVVRLGGGGHGEGKPGPPLPLINPQVIEASSEKKGFDGCLSFPSLYGRTVRPHHLRVTGLDEAGSRLDRVFKGPDAVVVHHEIDHLDGVLFVDRVGSIDDLYRVREGENGELMRVPVSVRMA
jgi:peptide deformylase